MTWRGKDLSISWPELLEKETENRDSDDEKERERYSIPYQLSPSV